MINIASFSKWIIFTVIIILLIILFEISFRKDYKQRKEFYEFKSGKK